MFLLVNMEAESFQKTLSQSITSCRGGIAVGKMRSRKIRWYYNFLALFVVQIKGVRDSTMH